MLEVVLYISWFFKVGQKTNELLSKLIRFFFLHPKNFFVRLVIQKRFVSGRMVLFVETSDKNLREFVGILFEVPVAQIWKTPKIDDFEGFSLMNLLRKFSFFSAEVDFFEIF